VQGIVNLHVRRGPDGDVEEAITYHGDPLLAAAAIEAAEHCGYDLIMADGRAVETQTDLEMEFR
jgi:hypothetical protein